MWEKMAVGSRFKKSWFFHFQTWVLENSYLYHFEVFAHVVGSFSSINCMYLSKMFHKEFQRIQVTSFQVYVYLMMFYKNKKDVQSTWCRQNDKRTECITECVPVSVIST